MKIHDDIHYCESGCIDADFESYQDDLREMEDYLEEFMGPIGRDPAEDSFAPRVCHSRRSFERELPAEVAQTKRDGEYHNPQLDDFSRASIHGFIDSKFESEWIYRWNKVRHLDRSALVEECVLSLRRDAMLYNASAWYTRYAVEREIDFYLPKAYFFYKVYRDNHPDRSPETTGINTDWPSFNDKSGWYFKFPITKEILNTERMYWRNNKRRRHAA